MLQDASNKSKKHQYRLLQRIIDDLLHLRAPISRLHAIRFNIECMNAFCINEIEQREKDKVGNAINDRQNCYSPNKKESNVNQCSSKVKMVSREQ